MEPDLIKNSTHGQSHNDDEEFGPNFKRLRMTDNVRELQTVLRDKYVLLLTPVPEVIKLFSCSTQLSTKLQLIIKLKYRQIKMFLALSLSDVVFTMLINVKMPTIVGILTFMSGIDFVLS